MTPYLDFYNLMAYDYAGSWSDFSGHQANIDPSNDKPKATPFSTAVALQHYTQVGQVPTSKMVLGMPMYGRAFTNTDGPGTAFSGVGSGSWENGVWDYKDLPRPGSKEHIKKDIASWSYDDSAKTMVSYDTLQMGEVKTDYILKKKLGGGMWWESSADKGGTAAKKEDGSLLGAYVDGVGGIKALDQTQNALNYPESKYDNLRNGMPNE